MHTKTYYRTLTLTHTCVQTYRHTYNRHADIHAYIPTDIHTPIHPSIHPSTPAPGGGGGSESNRLAGQAEGCGLLQLLGWAVGDPRLSKLQLSHAWQQAEIEICSIILLIMVEPYTHRHGIYIYMRTYEKNICLTHVQNYGWHMRKTMCRSMCLDTWADV